MRRHFAVWIGVLAALAISAEAQTPPADPDYGTECCQILQISTAAFDPLDFVGTGWARNFGYFCRSGTGNPTGFWAPVDLPSGSRIVSIGLFFLDNTLEADIQAALYANKGGNPAPGGSGPPAEVAGVQVTSSAAPGYGYASAATDVTVLNDVAFDPDAAQYYVYVNQASAADVAFCSLGFKAVEIRWQRQVSPAPATATFNDVPTNHPFFQFVEALASSAITAGCGSGNYCPDAPLTRGQMAVFLSKALGLHWAN